MKNSILLIVIVLFGLSEARNHHRHPHHHGDRRNSNSKQNQLNEANQDILARLNASVDALLASQQQNDTDDFAYAWDMINPCARFILLNQTQVFSQLSFEIEAKLKENNSSLNWCYLPSKVKSFLLGQKLPIILGLTYEQWGWNQNLFSNATLYSLLPYENQIILPSIANIISPIQFDLKLVCDELNQTISSSVESSQYLLDRYFDSFIRYYFNDWFENVNVNNKHENEDQHHERHHKRSAKHFFSFIRFRAKKFLKSVGFEY